MALGFALTTWVKTAEVLPENPVAPPYTAVIESVPTLNVVVVMAATPPARVAEPRVTPFTLKVTAPVGVPEAADTVAVRVTDCP